jgi:hypothetical protein
MWWWWWCVCQPLFLLHLKQEGVGGPTRRHKQMCSTPTQLSRYRGGIVSSIGGATTAKGYKKKKKTASKTKGKAVDFIGGVRPLPADTLKYSQRDGCPLLDTWACVEEAEGYAVWLPPASAALLYVASPTSFRIAHSRYIAASHAGSAR